jgi:hypothetical protein
MADGAVEVPLIEDGATRVHPFAAAFPMLPDDELAELAEDIKVNGLSHPILVTPDGELLDGRNRLAACRLVGVEPDFEVRVGNPYAVIVSENVRRRNLNAGQVAMASAVALVEQGQRVDGRWKHQSVSGETSSRMSMFRAGFILDNDPGAAALVWAGESLTKVYDIVKTVVAERAKAQQRIDELLTKAPALARLVTEGDLSIEVAWLQHEATISKLAREAQERREANIKRWQKTAGSVRSLAMITGEWMDDYDPADVGTDAQYLTTKWLTDARDHLETLIEWSRA